MQYRTIEPRHLLFYLLLEQNFKFSVKLWSVLKNDNIMYEGMRLQICVRKEVINLYNSWMVQKLCPIYLKLLNGMRKLEPWLIYTYKYTQVSEKGKFATERVVNAVRLTGW